ncbi:MAG: glycosyltransferase family 4 protein [Promethearchaeota archaeon]
MKILLLTAYFPPDTGSASHLFYELGKQFLTWGHEVKIVTSIPSYFPCGDMKKYKGKLFLAENYEGMRTYRVLIPKYPRKFPVVRGLWQFHLALAFLFFLIFLKNFDVILIYSPPLTLGLTGWLVGKLKKVPVILNIQDLFPQSAIDLGVLQNKALIEFFNWLEKFIYTRMDFITVHSEGNKKHVIGKGVNGAKVNVVPNWVDTDFISPERNKGIEFKKEFNLNSNFIVSFAGVIGYSQDMDVILEAAKELESYRDINFIIVGDGVKKQEVIERANELNLNNIHFIPMLPREKYPEVLYASDVCLATLKKEVKTPVVPSKILSIMAAGRPVVATMDLSGDAPKIIDEAKCGYALPPEDSRLLSKAILELYQNSKKRAKMGQNGRRFAEENFSIKVAAGKYEEIFAKLLSSD